MAEWRTRLSPAARSTLLLAFGGMLASCGGSSGNSTAPASTAPPTGVYRGTSAAGNNVLGLVLSDGRYYFLYSAPATPRVVFQINSGAGTSQNGNFTSSNLLSVPLFQGSLSGQSSGPIATGNFSASYTAGSSLAGTFTYLPSGGSTITTTYDASSTITPTWTRVAKTYSGTFSFYYFGGASLSTWSPTTTFSVSPSGALSGTVACLMVPVCTSAPCPVVTCDVTGTVAPRTDLGAYDVSLTVGSTTGGSTPFDGSYVGVAYYDAATGNLAVAGISPTTNHAIGFK